MKKDKSQLQLSQSQEWLYIPVLREMNKNQLQLMSKNN